MTEDSTKLFATYAERYPQPDDTDKARTAIEKIAEQVPFFGPATVYVLSQFLMPTYQRRQEEWFKKLADGVDQLAVQMEGFKIEDLEHNDAFVSATIQATRIAVATHQEEKRQYLRTALLNIAIGNAPNEDLQQVFFTAIADFTPSHILVLNVLWRGSSIFPGNLFLQATDVHGPRNYSAAIMLLYPSLKGQPELIQHIFLELSNRGFSRLSDSEASFPSSPTVTNLGINFLRFVLSVEELPK